MKVRGRANSVFILGLVAFVDVLFGDILLRVFTGESSNRCLMSVTKTISIK